MHRTLLIMALAGAAAFVPVKQAHAGIVDSILAVVDDEPILRSEVMADANRESRAFGAAAPDAGQSGQQDAVQRALDAAINNKLLLREAQLAGLEVTDEDVESQLEQIGPDYLDELQKQGETVGDIRQRLRKQLLARRMAFEKRRQFERAVVVSESQVAQYYEENLDQFRHPERVRVRQIFLNADGDREKVRAQAESLRRELEAGADFVELAAQYSDLPGAAENASASWFAQGDLIESLEEVAFSLEEGAISEVVATPGGFAILQLLEHEESGTLPLEEARKLIEPEVRRQMAERKYAQWLEGLRKSSRVQVFY